MSSPQHEEEDDQRSQTPENEEQEAEDDIRSEQERDERDERDGRMGHSSLAEWLFAKKEKMEKEKEAEEEQDAARDVEASGLEEGWKIPKAETRLLPLISGLLCPFSVLLDIPGLTERWYVRTENHVVVETQSNSPLLDIGLSVSLALGVIANLALIARFLEHRPQICTWISMLCLTVHDGINIAAVTVFAVLHRVDDGFTNGSAFWLTVASTAASLVCNVTLALDLWRTKDFDKKGSGLTDKQRSLTIVTMILLLYMGLGALIFHYLILDIDFISSLYFTICTITSVGFGDIVPVSVGSRIFSYFYDPVGIVLIALTVAFARECLIESFEHSYRQRRDKLAQRARERKEAWKKKHEEKEERRKREEEQREKEETGKEKERDEGEREREMGRLHAEAERRASGAATVGGFRRASLTTWAGTLKKVPSLLLPSSTAGGDDKNSSRAADKTAPLSLPIVPPVRPGEGQEGLCPSPSSSPTSPVSAGGAPSSAASASSRWSWRRPLLLLRRPSQASPSSPAAPASSAADANGDGGAPLHRSASSMSSVDDSFRTLKIQLAKEQKQEFRIKLGISVVLFLIFWLVGAAVFQATEKWTYFEGLWFGFVYFTTIGYGDLSPKSEAGRAFFCCWAILGIFNMTLLISVLTESFSSRYKSTISSGRVKKALRRVKPTAKRQQIIDNELLATAGYHPVQGQRGGEAAQASRRKDDDRKSEKASPISPQELPGRIVETVKGFHEHARYFMLGRTGLPPESLRFLYDAADADELDERLPDVIKGGPTSLADVGKQGDMKQYLFLIAYERQFDALLEAAEQLSSFLASQQDEPSTSRAELARVQSENGDEPKHEDGEERRIFTTMDDEGKEGCEEGVSAKGKDVKHTASSPSSRPQRPRHDRHRSSLTTGDIFPSLNLSASPSPALPSPNSPSGPSTPNSIPPARPTTDTWTSERCGTHRRRLGDHHAVQWPQSEEEESEQGGRRRSSLSFRLSRPDNTPDEGQDRS
ncbi:hypothetical protein JCM11251_005326 [Rhodosporidiobolus azoricus]